METIRGDDTFTKSLFSMRKLGDFIPPSNVLRAIRGMANEALAKLDPPFPTCTKLTIRRMAERMALQLTVA